MKLNGFDVSDSLIDRFLKLSSLPGGRHPSIKQQEYVSALTYCTALPKWMCSAGVSYFRMDSLIKENAALAAAGADSWISSIPLCQSSREVVSSDKIVLIAHGIFDDFFCAIYFSESGAKVISMNLSDEGVCWVEISDSFEKFLDCLEL